jgi:AraC-like DNA-binding protein
VVVDDVARSLGMSKRTLARRLSDEGLNFTEVLQQLRRNLAVRYLDDPKLHISKIAWLLGFNEVSAFTHAFKRWTGKTPSQMRIGSRCDTRPVANAPSAMASSSGEC